MSARVFNPLVMSEMRRMIGRSDASSTPAAVARVRRDLFGPVNHEDAQLFVDRELAAIRDRESDRWGFDFVTETPLDNSRFRWERVTPGASLPEEWRASYRLDQRREHHDQMTKDASTNTDSSHQSQKVKLPSNQTQITDYLKCRKRSLSAGDISMRKVGSAGDISSLKVGSAATSLSEPTKRKRSKTRQ